MKYLFFLSLLIAISCAETNNLSDTPVLEFISMSKNKMKQGSLNQDSLILNLKLSDGDGDIGYIDNNKKVFDFIIFDKRTNQQYDPYVIPTIPQIGVGNGVIINMSVILKTTCCILNPCDPDPNQSDEQLPLEIYIMDRAGNKSNVLPISGLILQCAK